MNLSRSEASPASGLLAQDYFSLLGLPEVFGIDQQQLDWAWRRLQAVVHPDRFSAGTDAQRRLALQWSTHLNEAYKTLKSPIARATYLLERKGPPGRGRAQHGDARGFSGVTDDPPRIA